MRTTRNLLLAVLFMFAMSVSAPAMATTTIFADNFDDENGGVGKPNYSGFSNWTVGPGFAVDLLPLGQAHAWLADAGHGVYVDLVASGPIGSMQLQKPLDLRPETYFLEFDLAGSPQPRFGHSVLDITVGNLGESLYHERISLDSKAPWTHYSREFEVSTPATVNIFLIGEGLPHRGPLIDNLRLTSTPFPPTLATTGVGLLALFLLGRRFRRP